MNNFHVTNFRTTIIYRPKIFPWQKKLLTVISVISTSLSPTYFSPGSSIQYNSSSHFTNHPKINIGLIHPQKTSFQKFLENLGSLQVLLYKNRKKMSGASPSSCRDAQIIYAGLIIVTNCIHAHTHKLFITCCTLIGSACWAHLWTQGPRHWHWQYKTVAHFPY